jgi:aldehyde:ferredoxin oxidoreductase
MNSKEKRLLGIKLWKERNPEKSKLYNKRYYEKNKKKRYEKHLEWLRKNKDKKREYGKRWRLKYREENKKRLKEWMSSVSGKKFYSDWRIKNREKTKAHYIFNKAIEHGIIKRPTRCSFCGVSCKTQGHHDDYSKPLEVVFVCSACHNGVARLR